jgi:hypothetical protein
MYSQRYQKALIIYQDPTSHFTWMLQTRCYLNDMYNALTCANMFKILPVCLDSILLAQQGPEWSVERHVAAQDICTVLKEGDTHGTVVEDGRKKASPLGMLKVRWKLTFAFLFSVILRTQWDASRRSFPRRTPSSPGLKLKMLWVSPSTSISAL